MKRAYRSAADAALTCFSVAPRLYASRPSERLKLAHADRIL